MWKSFENIGLQTSEKVSWEIKEKKHAQKHKIDRSQNGRSKQSITVETVQQTLKTILK